MPDPTIILLAQAAAAGFAVLVLLVLGWPWRSPDAKRATFAWALATGGAFLVGCWALGAWPKWPPTEDQGRLVYLLAPAAIFVEAMGALGVIRLLTWLLRIALAMAIAPTLLYGSIYLTDAAGSGTRIWSPLEATAILVALGGAVAGQWFSLAALQQRTSGRSLPMALAVLCAGASVTIMLSGYASGGQLGLPLAAALGVVAISSLLLAGVPTPSGGLGVALVILASLLIVGRFFGSLTTSHAAILIAAPLLCWLPELPPVSSIRPWIRGFLRVAIVVVPIALVLWQAQQTFVENSRPASQSEPTGPAPSLSDYLDFGK